MFEDMMGTQIKLNKSTNGHIFCSGMSGYGKTYLLDSLIKANVINNIPTVILDYSGSFTETELAKADIRVGKKVKIINPEKDTFNLPIISDIDTGKYILADILKESMGVKGYLNKKTLNKISSVACLDAEPSLIKIIIYAAKLLELSEDSADVRRLDNLISRLEFLTSLKKINVWNKPGIEISQKSTYIIDLNHVSAETKKADVNFIMNILWYGIKEKLLPYRCVILDECQHVDLHTGKVAAEMLREGRKFDLSMYMATQSIRDRAPDEIENIMQADNKIFFRPTEKECRTVSGLIGDTKVWSPIMSKLQIGQAVLKGKYFINNNPEELQVPIVISIKK